MKNYLMFLLFSFSTYSLSAADFTWNGAGDGTTFEQGTNWVGGIAPGTTDQAIFDGVTVVITSSNSQSEVSNIQLNNGADVTFNTYILATDNFFLENGSTATFNDNSFFKSIEAKNGGNNTLIFTVPPFQGRDLFVNGATTTLTHASVMDVPYEVGRDLEIINGGTFINNGNLHLKRDIVTQAGTTLTNNCTITLVGSVNCGGTCDPLVVSDCVNGPAAIPTMGEWALITLGLIILSLGLVYVMRWQKQMTLKMALK